MLDRTVKIYVAGHRGLVGSAIWNNLRQRGYDNLVGYSYEELDLLDGAAVKRFFDEERPDAVVLAAAHVGEIMANLQYRADFKDTYASGLKNIRNCHINVGTGKELSIKDVAGKVIREIGFKGELCWDTSKPDGTLRKLTDVTKLHNLGWHHKVEIDEGIHRLYQWYLEGLQSLNMPEKGELLK